MAEKPLPEWPAEPWIVSPGDSAGCVYQEGNDQPILIVDVWGDNPDQYVVDTAARVVACVNALAGVEDPEAFVLAARALLAAKGGEAV